VPIAFPYEPVIVERSIRRRCEANSLDPTDTYLALLLDIVAQRGKLQSRLKQLSAKLNMTAWPAPVIRLYLVQLSKHPAKADRDIFVI
jgi:hypothetical protein